jgi:hypothetical protein
MPERINGGQALVVLGAAALIVSLFLHWYEPGRSAWTVFEVWDLALAAIGIAALAAVFRCVGLGRRIRTSLRRAGFRCSVALRSSSWSWRSSTIRRPRAEWGLSSEPGSPWRHPSCSWPEPY